MAKLFANSEDPDQMLCSVASDLGLYCLPITPLRVSQLQWDKTCAASKDSDQPTHPCTTYGKYGGGTDFCDAVFVFMSF